MKTHVFSCIAVAGILLTGCFKSTRSISHSAYQEPPHAWAGLPQANSSSDAAFDYRGELSEFDILGLARNEIASEEDIAKALDAAKQVKLHRSSSILLIQSGAVIPDGPMVTALSRHFGVVPFSGVPPARASQDGQTESFDPQNYSRALRLAAARGGTDVIVCYWGILESETENLATKTISWVPVARWLVPDAKQQMRIRLKVALVDVRSGNWTIFSPKPFEDSRISASPRRGAVDQKQVEHLKQQAYVASAKDLLRLFSDVPVTD